MHSFKNCPTTILINAIVFSFAEEMRQLKINTNSYRFFEVNIILDYFSGKVKHAFTIVRSAVHTRRESWRTLVSAALERCPNTPAFTW